VTIGGVSHAPNVEAMRRMASDSLQDDVLASHIHGVLAREQEEEADRCPPRVLVTCVYGSGVDTPGTVLYRQTSNVLDIPVPAIDWVDGDGVVVASIAARRCTCWNSTQAEAVHVHGVPATNHYDIVALSAPLLDFLNGFSWQSVPGTETKR
jgi:hypothetical protein